MAQTTSTGPRPHTVPLLAWTSLPGSGHLCVRRPCSQSPATLPRRCVSGWRTTCPDGGETFVHTVIRKHEQENLEICEHYVTAPPTLSS